jgi:hypothetical protein
LYRPKEKEFTAWFKVWFILLRIEKITFKYLKMIKSKAFLFSVLLFHVFVCTKAQNTNINMFGHINTVATLKDQKFNSYMQIGEHDLFVTSQITDRLSFLGEFVVTPRAGAFAASIERAWIKYAYFKNHNLSIGKVHTPVNYWNDVYHHGRLFFPTIYRPMAFTYIVPIHTLGFRFQGQNLGKANFGYDIMIGNGMESTDVFAEGLTPSYTFAFHFKPVYGLRIGASYYYEYIENVQNMGSHAGHHTSHVGFHSHTPHTGFVKFNLLSYSTAYFAEKIELLHEFSYNSTDTDTLGRANNFSIFLYMGLRLNDNCIPFMYTDFINIAHKDLHSLPYNALRVGLGYRHEFNEFFNLKVSAEYLTSFELMSDYGEPQALSLTIQVAYGI